jgi:hypothetical protein
VTIFSLKAFLALTPTRALADTFTGCFPLDSGGNFSHSSRPHSQDRLAALLPGRSPSWTLSFLESTTPLSFVVVASDPGNVAQKT